MLRLFLLSLLARLIGLAWHLPATAAVVKLTPLLVVRAIVLNGIVGVAAGYLFWQYGLEAAMLAHFTGDIVLHIIGGSIAKSTRSRLVSA